MTKFWKIIEQIRSSLRKTPLWVAAPYGWLILFFVIPFLIIVKISISVTTTGLPPYEPLYQYTEDYLIQLRFTVANYILFFADTLYFSAFSNSLSVAFCATTLCLIMGYPMAHGICSCAPRTKIFLLVLIMLPFAASSLVRVYAWISLLSPHGLLNNALLWLGFIKRPLALMDNFFAVTLGMVHSYLPLMVLSLYAALEKIDKNLIEASFDLGCRPFQTFWKIIVPLSFPGAISGSLLVFIPAAGEFVIPELLGGPKTLMVGRLIWSEFFSNRDWPRAAALAIITLFILLTPIIIFQKFQKKSNAP